MLMFIRFSRRRLLLPVFSLIVLSTVVYFVTFELISWHDQYLLMYNINVCFGEESILIDAINRHMQAEQNRTKYRIEWEAPTMAEVEDFQRIADEPEKLYLYSAYFDQETQSVKLIGGALNEKYGTSRLKLFCQYYDHEKKLLRSHAGRIQTVEQVSSSIPYAGSFVICPLLQPSHCIIPTYVSVSLDLPNLGLPENLFYINYQAVKTPKHDFALCVQPAFEFEEPLQFVEWIEFYKLMGVTSFTFYNESIGPKTSCLMQTYPEVEVLKWSGVFTPDVEIPVHAQATQTNECIFRYRGRSKYVVYPDFDEFIMPSSAANYKEMFEQMLQGADTPQNSALTSSFEFLNGFFFKNETLEVGSIVAGNVSDPMNETMNDEAVKRKLVISNFVRQEDLTEPYYRSKYIANPNLVRKAGVHYLIESKPGSSMYTVPPEIGYLHHYREVEGDRRVLTEADVRQGGSRRVVEKSAERFREPLAKIVSQRLRQHSQFCDLDLDTLLQY